MELLKTLFQKGTKMPNAAQYDSWYDSLLGKNVKTEGLPKDFNPRSDLLPTVNIRHFLLWRNFFEWIGSILWPWAGAFYLIHSAKMETKT